LAAGGGQPAPAVIERPRPTAGLPVKAILCSKNGTPDDLMLSEVPDPVPRPGEVVAKVAAIGLNFFDTLIVAGRYQTKPTHPFSPGGEFSGTVESVGPAVTGFAPGDRVFGYTGFGAACERLAVPADHLVMMPPGLDFERAAALTITYGTSFHALKDRGRLREGETLAVLGASGGVGLAAVELGKLMGARVIACASSEEKLAFARAHGADEAVNYAKEDLKDALKRLGGPRGIDVIYDSVGGPYSEQALRALGWDGRHLVVGFAAGEIPRLPLNLVLLKACSVVGVFWGEWVRTCPAEHRAALEQLACWGAVGKLSCHVQKVYPLAEVPAALNALAQRKVMGKLVAVP
jgi:NADPH2:quinone reductase